MSTYDYGHNAGGGNAPQGPRQENDLTFWILVLISFVLFWPLGLFLVIRRFSGSNKQKRAAAQNARQSAVPPGWTAPGAAPRQGAPQQRAGAPAGPGPAARPPQAAPSTKAGLRWLLKIGGGVLAFFGALSTAAVLPPMLAGYGLSLAMLPALMVVLAMLIGGILLLVQGVRMDGAVKRYRQYLAVIGDRQSISFSQLAGVVGRSPKRVEDDLDAMITQGYFGPTAYLDLSLGYFFRSRTAAEEAAARRRAAAAPKEAEEGYAGILRAIRRANDAIADPVLSAKIDRLEEVTAQIFRIIEKDEKKESQVRMFLEYYLPTTQKLLDSYVEFEAAGVDGDNLRMAKEKIEETMDNIVRGFENQLDALYAAEAMDIQTDIDVMNNMMQRDSAMHTSDFRVDTGDGPRLTLDGEDEGAAAVQKQREG